MNRSEGRVAVWPDPSEDERDGASRAASRWSFWDTSLHGFPTARQESGQFLKE